MKKINQRGQATLLAILIITAISVVTAVGVSSRQNSALRRSSYTKQTDQGFACANSAVDTALLCIRNKEEALENPTTCNTSSPVSLPNGSCNYEYSVVEYTPDVSTGILKYPTIQKDNVLQINTENVDNIQIFWNSTAFLEISHIYKDGNDYKMDKYLVKRVGDNAPDGVNVGGGFSEWSGGGFYTLSNPTFSEQSESILRIRPYFNDASDFQIKSNDNDFATLSQGYKINAKGVSGEVIRNLEVIRTNPQLPAIFDYVLYSEEGSITK